MKKQISPFLISALFISFLLLCSQQCSQIEKNIHESNLYPSNAIDFSQSMLIYIKSELPYQSYSDTLRKINLKKLKSELNNHEKRLAFWLNIYNSLVQIRLTENPKLFKNKHAFFKTNDLIIGGAKLSLDDIENGILRLKTDVSNPLFTKRFRLDSIENRIHFTLNCGATSCPAIAYYNPKELDRQLEEATQFYVENNCEYKADKNEVMISELFSWFKDDFNGEYGVIEFLKQYKIIPESNYPKIIYKKYDWGVKPANFQLIK
jgi:hypothetical protein